MDKNNHGISIQWHMIQSKNKGTTMWIKFTDRILSEKGNLPRINMRFI